jgi:microcystin-dependent protein
MGQPFVGEIRMFGGSFAPAGWAFCQGQLIPISENETLFNLIGTTYGGDGQSTFALPNLSGRVPMHASGTHILGESAGTETVTLTVSQIPAHSHPVLCNANNGTQSTPVNNFFRGCWGSIVRGFRRRQSSKYELGDSSTGWRKPAA